MTKTDILTKLAHLNTEQQVEWMLALGANLTVAARNAYKPDVGDANGKALMAYNEIQHRVYARIRDLQRGHEWTLESFVSMIIEHSADYEIQRDVGWALKSSLPEAAN